MKITKIVTISGKRKEVLEQFALIASEPGTKVYDTKKGVIARFGSVKYYYEKGEETIIK